MIAGASANNARLRSFPGIMAQTITTTISVRVPWWIKRLYMPALIAAARLGFQVNVDRAARRIVGACKFEAR